MVQCVSQPAMSPWSFPVPEDVTPTSFNSTRPLSPILSPTATPTTAVLTMRAPDPIPIEIPPKVPPKSPPPKDAILSPSKANSKGASTIKGSQSKSALRQKEPPTSASSSSPPGSVPISPRTRSADRKPLSDPAQGEHPNESSTDTSIIHRGRPVKKSKKSRDLSSEPEPDGWKLPTGINTLEASQVLPESERDILKKQACGQVERFEVLRSKHVNTLSKACITPKCVV